MKDRSVAEKKLAAMIASDLIIGECSIDLDTMGVPASHALMCMIELAVSTIADHGRLPGFMAFGAVCGRAVSIKDEDQDKLEEGVLTFIPYEGSLQKRLTPREVVVQVIKDIDAQAIAFLIPSFSVTAKEGEPWPGGSQAQAAILMSQDISLMGVDAACEKHGLEIKPCAVIGVIEPNDKIECYTFAIEDGLKEIMSDRTEMPDLESEEVGMLKNQGIGVPRLKADGTPTGPYETMFTGVFEESKSTAYIDKLI